MKKLLALLLALVMVFTLCACGNNSNSGNSGKESEVEKEEKEETIVGKWVGEIDLTDILTEYADFDGLEKEIRDIVTPRNIGIKITFKFKEDGTASVSADVVSALEDYIDQTTDNMTDYLKDMLKDEDLTEQDFEDAYGMPLKTYISQMMDEMLGEQLEAMEEEFSVDSEGEYKLEGNKLYLGEDGEFEDYFKIDLDGDELTFKSYSGDTETAEIFENLVFERK